MIRVNGEVVNKISLKHSGIGLRYVNLVEPTAHQDPTFFDITKSVNISFSDSYEVEQLLIILNSFKNSCDRQIGTWVDKP